MSAQDPASLALAQAFRHPHADCNARTHRHSNCHADANALRLGRFRADPACVFWADRLRLQWLHRFPANSRVYAGLHIHPDSNSYAHANCDAYLNSVGLRRFQFGDLSAGTIGGDGHSGLCRLHE